MISGHDVRWSSLVAHVAHNHESERDHECSDACPQAYTDPNLLASIAVYELTDCGWDYILKRKISTNPRRSSLEVPCQSRVAGVHLAGIFAVFGH